MIKVKKRFVKIIFIFFISFMVLIAVFNGNNTAKADSLSDAVKNQVDNLNLDEIEEFFNRNSVNGVGFYALFNKLLQGEYDGEQGVFKYLTDVVFSDVSRMIPLFTGIMVITLLYSLIWNSKSAYLSDGVGKTIKYVAVMAVILTLSSEILYIWETVKNLIENIGKFSEIMSPIILTLMVASGGTASAALYKPSVLFFSDVVIQVFNYAVMPLIAVLGLLGIAAKLSTDINVGKFADFFGSVVKWIFGITITLYGFFITVQGISASAFDGVSVKVAKYALSNSIPIVGGLIKDGMDIITAGSVIIKNAFGISGVLIMFYVVLSPVIYMAVFSLLLKLTAAITEIYSEGFVSALLINISKTVSYLIATVMTVGLMAFITVTLMIFSANSVII